MPVVEPAQSTSIKIQSSISHTPEGTDTEHIRLIAVARIAKSKAHVASVSSIELSTTPVERVEDLTGELTRNSLISKF